MTQLEDRAGVKASLQGVKSTTDFATFERFVFCACLFGHESLILRTVRIRLLWGDRGARSRG